MKRVLPAMIAMAGISLFSCKMATDNGNNNSNGGTVSISSLKLADNEISGWTSQVVQYTSNGYGTCVGASGLQTLIDGGFEAYTKNGFVEGSVQEMGNTDAEKKFLISWVFDQGSTQNATTMFHDKKTALASPLTFADYADSFAVAHAVLGGVTAYSHFKNIYLELSFSGYADQNQAMLAAGQFIGVYKAKIMK